MNVVVNLSVAWDEVQGSTLNAAWSQLYPRVATESSEPTKSILHLHQEIAGLARQVGLGEINEEDIAELLESYDEELANSDLLEIERHLTEHQEAPEPRNSEQAKTLSTKDLSEAFSLLENAMAIFTEKDPQQERSTQVKWMITNAYSCYREIRERKKRHAQQQTLNRFLQHR